MEYKIALMPGDGIGPEIIKEARKVLDATAKVYGHTFSYEELLLGGASIDAYGEPLTEETIAKAKSADAVLMGAVGADAKTSPWYRLSPEKRPEAGLLKLRKELKLFANLRPAYLYEALKDACPVKEQFYQTGIDLMIVRELTGGLYFGERKTVVENGIAKAVDTLTYDEKEIRRIAKKAFEGKYEEEVILKWLKVFYRRFFSQQFKRSCLPDGPKVGSAAVSPRGDLRMPSDACSRLWLEELETLDEDCVYGVPETKAAGGSL